MYPNEAEIIQKKAEKVLISAVSTVGICHTRRGPFIWLHVTACPGSYSYIASLRRTIQAQSAIVKLSLSPPLVLTGYEPVAPCIRIPTVLLLSVSPTNVMGSAQEPPPYSVSSESAFPAFDKLQGAKAKAA
jgi:hypothetical protein